MSLEIEETAFGLVEEPEDGSEADTPSRDSMYVSMFDEMLETVLQHEIFLFTPAEIAFFEKYRALSDQARYLLIRLCLRKSGTWFRECKLRDKYGAELGTLVLSAMEELWNTTLLVDRSNNETIRLEDCLSDPRREIDSCSWRFARSDEEASVEALLDCLSRDELKILAKQNHVGRPDMTMRQMKESLLSHSSTQSILLFPTVTTQQTSSTLRHTNPVTFTSKLSRPKTVHSERLRHQVLKITTRCIRIDDAARKLFRRLNLVYLRCTNSAEVDSLLLPCLLNRSRKRCYPSYCYARTASVFPGRSQLLSYEDALLVEAELDSIQGSFKPPNKTETSKVKGKGVHTFVNSERPRTTKARQVRDIWVEHWDRWKEMVANHAHLPTRTNGLERFESGHILTRVMYKGADALAALNEHELEIDVLQALLAQTRWRRGNRGAWWERLVVIYMNHLEASTENLQQALTIAIQGLEDPLTHMKYRPSLERRLKRLEARLKPASRYKCNSRLKKHAERIIEGVRIWGDLPSRSVSRDRRALRVVDPTSQSDAQNGTEVDVSEPKKRGATDVDRAIWKGKSIWYGGDGDAVTVETLVLEYYERLGYKGFHKEGRIVSCLFSLLFWDILFSTVPGAFETSYQTAPLDLWEDSFYYARKDVIEKRLVELEEGKARQILDEVDQRERPKNTWCIGVRWDAFPREDLLEIVECMGGKVLSSIGRLLAEDYALGTAGVPDLFVWNAERKTSMFVEVKGPGDSLQENQKVWIDILLRAGITVELCKVVEEGEAKPKEPRNKRVLKKRRAGSDELETMAETGMEASQGNATMRKRSVVEIAHPEDVNGPRMFVHNLSPRKRKRSRKSV